LKEDIEKFIGGKLSILCPQEKRDVGLEGAISETVDRIYEKRKASFDLVYTFNKWDGKTGLLTYM